MVDWVAGEPRRPTSSGPARPLPSRPHSPFRQPRTGQTYSIETVKKSCDSARALRPHGVDSGHDRDALVERHHGALEQAFAQATGDLVSLVTQAPALVRD